jgi:hypothetical protein
MFDDSPEDGPLDEQGRIAADCPCIRCGYNLRTLLPDINCPECGCPVSRTLNLIEQRVLCPTCLAPVHPSATNCPRCDSPLNAAASIAGYAGGKLHLSTNYSSAPSRPSFFILMWIWWILAPLSLLLGFGAAGAVIDFLDEPNEQHFAKLMVGFFMLVGAVVFGALVLFSTRGYLVRSRAYEKAMVEEDRLERELGAKEKTRSDD